MFKRRIKLKAFKEKQYLVFRFADGKDVKYNLATGESIGKLGKPVKDICTQLRGYRIKDVIKCFENENYRAFLDFIDSNFINKSTNTKHSWRRVDKITNVGTFLSRIKDYDYFEQFFACGIRNISHANKFKINDVPKGLIKLCREKDITLNDKVLESYKNNPDLWNMLFGMEFEYINCNFIVDVLTGGRYEYNTRKFYSLIHDYNYTYKALFLYLDHLASHEALDNFWSTIGELKDYCDMMSTISPKYDKYPRNFLTTHKIAVRNYNRLKEVFDEEMFIKRIDKSLEYTYGSYKIVYPKSTQDIKDEAVQQNNCVASYIDKVMKGICDILFLRKKDELENSLVTLEVRDGKVVQAKRKYNYEVTKEQQTIIDKYNKRLERLNVAC